jgi:hypothetical protein
LGGIASGNLSGGRLPIWPSGKNPANTSSLKGVDEAFSLNRNVSNDAISGKNVGKAASVDSPNAEPASAVAPKISTQIKQLTPKDIIQQLAKMNIPVTDHNHDIALLMAAYGVEISEDSFDLVNKLLKGDKSALGKKNAVLLVSKGLGNAVDSAGILNAFFESNKAVSEQLKGLLSRHSQMASLLQQSLADFPGLSSFLTIFDDFNQQLKRMNTADKTNPLLVDRDGFLTDIQAMSGFLKGLIQNNTLSSSEWRAYLNGLDIIANYVASQKILSQPSVKQPLGLLESYDYFQIPNPLAASVMIDILRRKQTTKDIKDAKSNNPSAQEKIIVSMDSDVLGRVTVIVTIMGINIWCLVYADNDHTVYHSNAFRQELIKKLAEHDYRLSEFKTVRKKVDIQKFIAPSQNLSDVKRIQTEI